LRASEFRFNSLLKTDLSLPIVKQISFLEKPLAFIAAIAYLCSELRVWSETILVKGGSK